VDEHEFFAPCPRGLEGVCADELRHMGLRRIRPLRSGVCFFGTLDEGMRAALWTRVASRVLLVVSRVPAADADELYVGVRDVDWPSWFSADCTIAVDANGTNAQLRNTQFLAQKVKDAVCDRFRQDEGRRPDVDSRNADVRINVSLHARKATLALDLVGGSLHRRGYRTGHSPVKAPLKETLAAGVVLLAGWPDIARRGGAFVDPMCGSGTLALEAALVALDVAPGILRHRWCFESWRVFDAHAWDALLDEADERAESGRVAWEGGRILASDIDASAVEAARGCAHRMRLDDLIEFSVADVADLVAPKVACGLVACNPPYGERLATRAQLPALYAALGRSVRTGFSGFELAVITSDPAFDEGIGLATDRDHVLFNGPLQTTLHLYHLGAAEGARPGDEGASADITGPTAQQRPAAVAKTPSVAEGAYRVQVGEELIAVEDRGTDQFVARLKKVAGQRRKWARRNGISCYRVYDADLPDFALAIDLLSGTGRDEGDVWVRVSEYAAPRNIDPAKAQRRVRDALAVIPPILHVPVSNVFLKIRRHDRGGSQYEVEAAGHSFTGIVAEGGLRFQVNLSERLDCGLFLDQRITRARIRDLASGTRFLNLFAYTGTATVYAAAGGARETTTVDLSQTYLDWARRNMELNGFSGGSHEFVRADCRRFVDEQRSARRHWDLVFVDVPTFSNSRKMGRRTFDVQRDHAELLIGVSRLLARDGLAIFSCNLRSFTPDISALERGGVALEDITSQTIPEDFSRNPRVHHCYLVRRVR
jgi:23S rRNA (guanine2445-N2)-methyltransferase / 23S rRNA (guanine2069-N7)-methyltransferase